MKNGIYQYGSVHGLIYLYEDILLYSGGIYQHVTGNFCGVHSIVYVGWGEENGVKYWVARNSWGTEWGENGFFRVIVGVAELYTEGECYVTIVK